MKFLSLEQPSKKGAEILTTELKEDYHDLEIRMTFIWPLSKSRETALDLLKSDKPDKEKVLELLKSDDFIEQGLALDLIIKNKDIAANETDYKNIRPIFDRIQKNSAGNYGGIRTALKEIDLRLRTRLEGEKILPLLADMAKHTGVIGPEEYRAVAAMGELGETAFPFLDQIIDNEGMSSILRGFAAKIKIQQMIEGKNDKAVFLSGLMGHKNAAIRKGALEVWQSLDGHRQFLEKDISCIEEILKTSDDLEINFAVAKTLSRFGSMTKYFLENLASSKNWATRVAAVEALGNLGEEALPILENIEKKEMQKYRDNVVFNAIKRTKDNILHTGDESAWRNWLLSSRKPLFATPYTEELAERIKKINELVKELQNKFQDDFIGLVVFGSTTKGYFEWKSDLDASVIAKNPEVMDYFKQSASAFKLCPMDYDIGISKKDQKIYGDTSIFFHGLFFGNRGELLKLQKSVVENYDNQEWNNIRDKIWSNETNIYKAGERFNIPIDEIKKIQRAVGILRVPPPRSEMLKILHKRL